MRRVLSAGKGTPMGLNAGYSFRQTSAAARAQLSLRNASSVRCPKGRVFRVPQNERQPYPPLLRPVWRALLQAQRQRLSQQTKTLSLLGPGPSDLPLLFQRGDG